tara:strand:- start:2613 stop:3065 length:453 start_codon:yes stop_codon:yes gene_type:complete
MNNIHDIISNYFNNPIMTKLKDDNNQSFYFIKIFSQLLNSYRYIIAIVPQDDHPLYKKTFLTNIPWTSLQTRTLKTNYNIPSISYNSNSLDSYNINVFNRTNNYTTYTSKDFTNIQIHVFITSNNMYEYPEHATISNALEKYQTIINIIN